MPRSKALIAAYCAALLLLSPQVKADGLPGTPEPLELLREEAEANPADIDIYFAYATSAKEAGEMEEAEKAYLHIIKTAPEFYEARLALAALYINMDKKTQAKAVFKEILLGNSSAEVKQETRNLIAHISKSIKKRKRHISGAVIPPFPAFETDNRSPAKPPTALDEYFSYPKMAAEIGSDKEAEEALLYTLKINPAAHGSKLDLAMLYARTKRYNEAASLLTEIMNSKAPDAIKTDARTILAATTEVLEASPDMAKEIVETNAELAELKAKMEANPKNLDNYFEYAQKATNLGQLKKAEEAYKHMLEVAPELERVKLDLALLHFRMGKYADSEKLLKEVEATNPPESVKQNIKTVLIKLEEAQKPHRFYGRVSIGQNYDTNANSVSNTDQVTFQDISLPLEDSSRGKKDGHMYIAGTINHDYRVGLAGSDYEMLWKSSATVYRSEQANLDDLDLMIATGRTGPLLNVRELNTAFGLNAIYTYIALANHEYLNSTGGELSASHRANENWLLKAAALYEDRRFKNSPTNTTFADRTGDAYHLRLATDYTLSERDLLSVNTLYRRENTRTEYNDNTQIQLNLGYMHLFDHDIFLNSALNLRKSKYDGPDPLISLNKTREDVERSVSFLLGKKILPNTTVSAGYQFRKVESNIQNFDYDNHRFSSEIGVNF